MDDAAMWERIMQLTPLRRWAEPNEIAEWVYFVGVTNRFMTGQNLLIDGGEARRRIRMARKPAVPEQNEKEAYAAWNKAVAGNPFEKISPLS